MKITHIFSLVFLLLVIIVIVNFFIFIRNDPYTLRSSIPDHERSRSTRALTADVLGYSPQHSKRHIARDCFLVILKKEKLHSIYDTLNTLAPAHLKPGNGLQHSLHNLRILCINDAKDHPITVQTLNQAGITAINYQRIKQQIIATAITADNTTFPLLIADNTLIELAKARLESHRGGDATTLKIKPIPAQQIKNYPTPAAALQNTSPQNKTNSSKPDPTQ